MNWDKNVTITTYFNEQINQMIQIRINKQKGLFVSAEDGSHNSWSFNSFGSDIHDQNVGNLFKRSSLQQYIYLFIIYKGINFLVSSNLTQI